MTEIRTMNKDLIIRVVGPEDNLASKQLQESYVEGGRISTRITLKTEDANAALDVAHPGNYRLLAYYPGNPIPIGTIAGWPHSVKYKGENIPAVLVHRLAVHPDYRQQGVAKALWQALDRWIKTKFDTNRMLVYGYYQKGNEASQAWFKSIGGIFTGLEVTLAPVKVLNSNPNQSRTNLFKIEELESSQTSQVVNGLNEFYKDYSLYKPISVEDFEEWLKPKTIGGSQLNLTRYYVATNSGGEVLAGLGVFDRNQLFDIKIVDSPRVIKLLNKLLKLIPEDGYLKLLQVSRVWYKPDQLEAGRTLWQAVRRRERTHGRLLELNFDRASDLNELYNLGKLQPTTKYGLMIIYSQDKGVSITHPLYF